MFAFWFQTATDEGARQPQEYANPKHTTTPQDTHTKLRNVLMRVDQFAHKWDIPANVMIATLSSLSSCEQLYSWF